MPPASRTYAEHLQYNYDWFREQSDPFNLNDEIAMLRTLMVEVREGIEDSGHDKLLQFADVVQGLVFTYLTTTKGDIFETDEATEIADGISVLCIKAYNAVYGNRPRMSPKDALDIVKSVELISKVSERYKKMADGVVLRVEYDNNMGELLTKFVINVVMKHVPMKSRRLIATACYEFLPNLRDMAPMLEAGINQEDVIEHDHEGRRLVKTILEMDSFDA